MAPFTVGTIDVKLRDALKPQTPPATQKTRELPKGHKKRPECRPLPATIIHDEDAILTLRDGTKLHADIFRPKTEQKVPAIVMWGPYGKSGSGLININVMPMRAGIPESRLSGYEDFEGLDPAEWVSRGYAILNVDARGVNDSEGNIQWWGTGEGRDGYDAIEEIARLPWCTGKVGMAGNSWLAIVQYFIAAERPPHLACIAPLEGLSDPLREDTGRGGIPNLPFAQDVAGALAGRQQQEDWAAMVQSYPVTNEYFEDKRVEMTKIDVPAYIAASYSTALHTIGSLRAFEEIPHKNKWLVLHATQEWYDLYSNERTEDMDKFFAYHLKGVQNSWPQTAPVRIALLNHTKPALVDQEFPDLPWHLASTTSRQLHLSPNGELTLERHTGPSTTLSYQADSNAEVAFTYVFPARTVLTGPSTLILHISAPDHDDMDIHTHIFKADQHGTILSHLNIPIPESAPPAANFDKLTNNRLWRYWGPNGMLRASKRDVSAKLSGQSWKTLSHSRDDKVKPGEIVRLSIQLWPMGLVFEAGEKLVLKISGGEIGARQLPHLPAIPNANKGKHVLHFGGTSEACLQFFTL
ncbi:alpha/beta-hydrolase [Clathrospora elynae]|uniref:Alpha/beta-hydrolase n=1 Tax=Clathrospora elynae TaxID=706981 RepID=A0A6A5SF83_9PLEO|nr:alpha/beta-hydrolase [Clathrospora elynae]